ncbi:MAG: hypothetical protein U0L03_06045 [Succinivibrionaceae bacterium]|nr:hypothetical protein [Succinivibrionaceae bacterium]
MKLDQWSQLAVLLLFELENKSDGKYKVVLKNDFNEAFNVQATSIFSISPVSSASTNNDPNDSLGNSKISDLGEPNVELVIKDRVVVTSNAEPQQDNCLPNNEATNQLKASDFECYLEVNYKQEAVADLWCYPWKDSYPQGANANISKNLNRNANDLGNITRLLAWVIRKKAYGMMATTPEIFTIFGAAVLEEIRAKAHTRSDITLVDQTADLLVAKVELACYQSFLWYLPFLKDGKLTWEQALNVHSIKPSPCEFWNLWIQRLKTQGSAIQSNSYDTSNEIMDREGNRDNVKTLFSNIEIEKPEEVKKKFAGSRGLKQRNSWFRQICIATKSAFKNKLFWIAVAVCVLGLLLTLFIYIGYPWIKLEFFTSVRGDYSELTEYLNSKLSLKNNIKLYLYISGGGVLAVLLSLCGIVFYSSRKRASRVWKQIKTLKNEKVSANTFN